MAYNPYPYNNYQTAPYYPTPVPDQLALLRQSQMPQPPMPAGQPMQSPMGQTPQAAAPQGIIWVSGKSEADGYLVTPNSAVALWDANNPVIYLRKADSTGKPSTVVYDLVERTDAPPIQPVPQIDLSNYVTLDQLEEILSKRLKKAEKSAKKEENE